MKVIEVSPRRSPFSTMNWIVLLSFLLSNVSSVHSSWWSLSRIPPKSFRIKSDAHALCSGGIVPGLSREQRDLCLKRPDLMVSAARGAKIAIKECKRLFAKSRWNCSTFDRDSSVFGKLASRGHRETALIYALTSAGVVYSVARSCYSGTSTNCSCVMEANHPSGCVLHGERFVRGFVDTREKPNRDARAMMNLRNNEAGRRAVRRQVEQQCKCHGFSGSCSQRTCWHSLKSFRDVGLHLRQKYDAASLMTISQDGRRLVLEDKKLKHPTKSDLVYLEHSPDYCQADLKLGILGTAGRRCNKTSLSTDGCDILCCGRGHDTALVKKEEKCRCKFKWCCQVHCQRCTRTSSIHNCKA